MSQPAIPTRLEIDVPAEVLPGTYADFVSVWHTGDVFVLDFAALVRAPVEADDGSGGRVVATQASVTTRVRIPPGQVFEVMKALEAQLSSWERERSDRREG